MRSEVQKFQADLLASVKQMRRGQAARVSKVKLPAAFGVAGRHPPRSASAQYHLAMQLVTGTVVEGKVVLNGGSLPDGTVVTVYAHEPGNVVRLPPHLQAELEAAIDEADREEGISAEELFAQIKKYR